MLLGLPKIVLYLLIQPAFGGSIECNRQPYRHFGTNTRLTVDDARKRFAADTKRFGRFIWLIKYLEGYLERLIKHSPR